MKNRLLATAFITTSCVLLLTTPITALAQESSSSQSSSSQSSSSQRTSSAASENHESSESENLNRDSNEDLLRHVVALLERQEPQDQEKLAKAKKLYDVPNERKIHTSPIPSLGGIGIFIGFFTSFLFFANTSSAIPILEIALALMLTFLFGVVFQHTRLWVG